MAEYREEGCTADKRVTAGTLPPSSQYENRPQIIKVEFASPPSGDGRADQLVTNGQYLRPFHVELG